MQVAWTTSLVDQIEFYWEAQFWPRLAGLTEDEYLWEPVAGCWTVREAPGGYLPDWEPRPADPPPVTTIAWRIAHILGPTLGTRASRHFGDGSYDVGDPANHAGTAEAALDLLQRSYRWWVGGLRSVPDDQLGRACGEPGFEDHPLAALVLHIHREVFHHGGEIGVLRDLYRAGLR